MQKFSYLKKTISLVYIFFYLIFSGHAISKNNQLNIISDLEKGLNERDLTLIEKYFSPKENIKLQNKFNILINEFPNATWIIKEAISINKNNHILAMNITGSKMINDKKFNMSSNFLYKFQLKNGMIKNSSITNHLTTIRNDNNKVSLDISIPDKVLTGSNYELDIIINDPLDQIIIAGGIKEYQEETFLDQSISLEPLATGGIFKVTRAPFQTGTQIWSGIIAHPEGLVSFTKSVEIVEKY